MVAGNWRVPDGALSAPLREDGGMNESRIIQLRQDRGWTQEKLATESGVGIRTIQRLEAGNDASLETLSLVADALGVPVRDLFASLDSTAFGEKLESLEARAEAQQVRRNRITSAWLWLFIGLGVAVSMVSFFIGGAWGGTLFLIYWGGGSLIFVALRRLVVEPRLNEKLPLSRSNAELRKLRRSAKAASY